MKLLVATAITLSLLASASAQTNQAGGHLGSASAQDRVAINQNHSQRLAALSAGAGRELHRLRARRSSVPGERSGSRIRRPSSRSSPAHAPRGTRTRWARS